MADPVLEYVISRHATMEMPRRGFDEAIVRRVLTAPEQREAVQGAGRDVHSCSGASSSRVGYSLFECSWTWTEALPGRHRVSLE